MTHATTAEAPKGPFDPQEIYTTGSAGQKIKADPKTVSRWVIEGRVGEENEGWFRTPGGHMRMYGWALNRAIARATENPPTWGRPRPDTEEAL